MSSHKDVILHFLESVMYLDSCNNQKNRLHITEAFRDVIQAK